MPFPRPQHREGWHLPISTLLNLSGVGCSVVHMFDRESVSVGLRAGEADTASVWDDDGFDDLVYLLTVEENTCREDDRHVLPDLDSISPGLFLYAILGSVDRSRLNGFDLVRLLRARERLVSHHQAGSAADV